MRHLGRESQRGRADCVGDRRSIRRLQNHVLLLIVAFVVAGCAEPVRSDLGIRGVVKAPSGERAQCGMGLSSPDYSLPEIGQTSGEDGSYYWSVPGPGEFTVSAYCGELQAAETVVVDDRSLDLVPRV